MEEQEKEEDEEEDEDVETPAGRGQTASVPVVSLAILLSGRTKPVQTPATVSAYRCGRTEQQRPEAEECKTE